MRLVDLLLVLLFEGRKALSRTGVGCVGAGQLLPRLRRMDSAGEKSHRQLIDCIRSKDTDALVEAIDTGGMMMKVFKIASTLANSKLFFLPFLHFIFILFVKEIQDAV
jgi:E3 ubiquitin-protein ligase HECTD1